MALKTRWGMGEGRDDTIYLPAVDKFLPLGEGSHWTLTGTLFDFWIFLMHVIHAFYIWILHLKGQMRILIP